jgi:hypothetical protein
VEQARLYNQISVEIVSHCGLSRVGVKKFSPDSTIDRQVHGPFKPVIFFIIMVGKWDSEKNGSLRTTTLFWGNKTVRKDGLLRAPVYFLSQEEVWNIEHWENKALFRAPADWKLLPRSLNVHTETITLTL